MTTTHSDEQTWNPFHMHTRTHTSKNDDFLILEDIPIYTAHICAHLSHPRWGFGLGRCKSLWTQPWLDEIYKSPRVFPCSAGSGMAPGRELPFQWWGAPWEISEKNCMEDKKSLKKRKVSMENKDNMLRYECGLATSTVINSKNLFAMCFMTFRIWSCCWKFLSQTEASSTAKSLEAVFLDVPMHFKILTCFCFSGLQFLAFGLGLCCAFGSATGRSRSALGATQPMAAGHWDGGQQFGPGEDAFPC